MSLTKFDGVHSSIGLVFDLQTAEPTDSSYALNVGSGLASAGLWMESDGIHWSYNGTEFSITASYSGGGAVVFDETLTVTGATTLSSTLTYRHLTETVAEANVIAASESGTVFFLNDATEFASTLPAPAAGLHFTFIVTGAPAGADYTITTNAGANIILGMVVASTGGDEDSETSGCDTISFVGGKSTVGDKVDVYCDGTNWFAYGICDATGAITLTTAA